MSFFFPGNPGGYVAFTVPIIMLAWFPIVIYLFMRYPARKAIVISFVVAWLFLPEAALILPSVPDYTKMSATCYGVLIATIIYEPQRLNSYQIKWLDIPMLIWSIGCPVMSSMSNGLGPYDGFSEALNQSVSWFLPYFLGRIYVTDLAAIRQLAIGVFLGGLAYIPLCLYEVRMSPQLHRIFYGSAAFSDFMQSVRYDGFRPLVFLIHGLAVASWMMIATLVGIWLWQAKSIKKIRNIAVWQLSLALVATFALLKSTGAYFLLGLGVIIMLIARSVRTALPIFLLTIFIGLYLYQNTQTEKYITDQVVMFAQKNFEPDRVQSLTFRFDNEELLVDHARKRIAFGWGGWGRSDIHDPETGQKLTTPDSLWIIAFSKNGTAGLVAMMVALLLPLCAFSFRYPARTWMKPEIAPAAALSIGLLLAVIDNLLNAVSNPVYLLTNGALVSIILKPRETGSRQIATQIKTASQPREIGSPQIAAKTKIVSQPRLQPRLIDRKTLIRQIARKHR